MKKTMIYLDDDQYLLLKREADLSKRRMTEIIRDALTGYFNLKKKGIDYFSFVGIAEGPPKGKTSEEVEEILREELK